MKSLEEQVHELQQIVEQQQAQIDELMLEFCPEKMSEKQKENWAKHQVPADSQPTIKDLSGYEKITSNDQLLVDHYYWIRSKQFPDNYLIAEVKLAYIMLSDETKHKALIVNNMYFWAYEKNSQAIETYDIYGPINEPFHIEVVG